jgi:hypothetical protein
LENKLAFSLLVAMSIISIPSIAMAKGATGGYQSGYNHGVSDAHTGNTRDWYILQPGKGFAFHTHDFIAGYVDGFCSIAGSHMSSDSDKAMWDCARGSDSASWVRDGN